MNFPTSCHLTCFWVFPTLAINQESPRAPPVLCLSLFPSARIPGGTVAAGKISLFNPDIFSHFVVQRLENQVVRREFTCKSFSSLARVLTCSRDGFLTLSRELFSVFNSLKFFPAFYPFLCWNCFPLGFHDLIFFLYLHFIFIHRHNLSCYTFLRLSPLDDIAPKSYFARPCFSSLLQTLRKDELANTWNHMIEEKSISSLDWYLSPSSFLLFSWSSLSYVLSW